MTPSPIKFQEVIIGGQVYQLKFGAIAENICSELGVSIQSFFSDIGTPRAFSDYLKLFAGMVAHHFLRLKMDPPTARQWSLMIEDEGDRPAQLKKSGEIIEAVRLTLNPNWKTAEIKLREPAPTPETTPSPVN